MRVFGTNTSAGTYSTSVLHLASVLSLIWLTLCDRPRPSGSLMRHLIGEPSAQCFTANSV